MTITVWNLGHDLGFVTQLRERGCEVTCLPATASARDIKRTHPDAIVIAGGDADPAEHTDKLPVINDLFGKFPILGVGLGHDLVALARGGTVAKLPEPHDGEDIPVTAHQQKFTTAQAHSYVVTDEPSGTLPVYRHGADRTCEGIFYTTRYCLTVAFEPNDAVLDRFFALIQ